MLLKHMQSILKSYETSFSAAGGARKAISLLDEMSFKVVLFEKLHAYCREAIKQFQNLPQAEREALTILDSVPHTQTIKAFLDFLCFYVQEHENYFDKKQFFQLWELLVKDAPCDSDRKQALDWIKDRIEDQDIEPENIKEFYDTRLRAVPNNTFVFEHLRVFWTTFLSVNADVGNLTKPKRRSILDSVIKYPLSGTDTLWDLLLTHPDSEIAEKAMDYILSIWTAAGASISAGFSAEEVIQNIFSAVSGSYFELSRKVSI